MDELEGREFCDREKNFGDKFEQKITLLIMP